VDERKVKIVNRGEAPFFEPGLSELVRSSVKNGLLRATTNPMEAVLDIDITFITVGTPSKEDGNMDLAYVEEVSKMIG